ncbi:MAG: DNA topoisomerase I, partial [Thaumarchaeota archaeon]|nr:DNA topoisomerase I [Nitrososphaerota archaeon]
KPRVLPQDVTLNLDKGAPVPEGYRVTNDDESIWIARWIDKLTGKEKYVWPHESSDIQQSRNKQKYDKALKIGERLPKLQAAIRKKLADRDERERKIATVCYLIDEVGMRVGDEKDEDEADTVGATTLRVEHIKRLDEQAIEFDFLGKDSVRWVKKLDSPDPALVGNMRKFMTGNKPDAQIFEGVNSAHVNAFLSGIVDGLSAKVFRTYHATRTVEEALKSKDVRTADDLEKLYFAKEANLAAAIYCNHKRTPPKTWDESLKKKEQKLAEYRTKGKEERIQKMEKDIELTKKTKEYNLNTSMKNYIDPRTYKSWCDYVGLDWNKLYSKSLQRKFSWVAQSRRVWADGGTAVAPVAETNPHETNPQSTS